MSKLRRFLLAWTYFLGHWFGRAQQWIRGRSRPTRTGNTVRLSRRRTQAGFILPTTSLLLVVVALTITAMSLRSLNRVDTVAGDRQQKIIYNAATPSIDRAKSKLEKLFSSDPRRTPTGVPPEEYLLSLMLNDNGLVPALGGAPYTLPGETRLDINGDGAPDNAWQYAADTNGDNTPDATIAYSITFKTPVPTGGNFDPTVLFSQDPAAVEGRASNLEVRSGPLQSDDAVEGCNLVERLGEDFLPPLESGWFQDSSTTANLRKNFQIDAVVVPIPKQGEAGLQTSAGLNTIATLELQQDKLAARGNRWAAWFRNDLELFPGPAFNWNGAMHTEGSLFLASRERTRNHLTLYLVSSPASCLYGLDASQLSASGTGSLAGSEAKDFDGDFVASSLSARFRDFRSNPTVSIHYQQDTENTARGAPVIEPNNFTPTTDSVDGVGSSIDLGLDPLPLFTEDLSQRRSDGNVRNGGWTQQPYVQAGRTQNDSLRRPYLDDFYRADNRYGPRASYGSGEDEGTQLPAGTQIGTPIGGNIGLTRNSNPSSTSDLGLDGYWERRAIQEGLRLIVGQRLELGGDSMNPLSYPKDNAEFDGTRPHATLQRRSLRDLLAAVQGTLVYHHRNGGAEPIAAMATVVHPGTPESLKAANTFESLPQQFVVRDVPGLRGLFGDRFGNDPDEVVTDFFEGRGTNGWEFDVTRLNAMMPAGTNESRATVQFAEPALRQAVQNLAALSGDPDGAFPAVQEAGTVHPYPELTKWGNFSELRRSLTGGLDSPADQSTQQTAGLTMGMLGYNLSYLDALDYNAPPTQTIMQNLAEQLGRIGDKTANFGASLTGIDEGTQGDPNLPDSDAAAWSTPASTPGPVGTDFLTARRQDFESGKVDILRQTKQPDSPFAVRVYPSQTTLAGGTAGALAAAAADASRYVEVQLSDAQGTPEASPPFAEAPTWQEESPRVPPEAYVFALGEANGNPNETGVNQTDLQQWARLVALKEQVWRDRNFGFAPTFGRATNTGGANPNRHQFSYQIQHIYPGDPAQVRTNSSGVSEDLDDDGILDPGEDVNFNGRLDVQNELNSTDSNQNGIIDERHEFDANGNGIIDAGEDLNGNNVFDRTAWYAFGGRTFYQGEYYEFGCDFSQSTGNNYFGFGYPTDFATERRFLHLATTLCPVEAKYPSLYYLFPTADHDFRSDRLVTDATVVGAPGGGTTTETVEVNYTQPRAGLDEDYLDPFLTDAQVAGIIGNTQFIAIDPTLIAIKPMPLDSWRIPLDRGVTPPADCADSAPLCSQSELIAQVAPGGVPPVYHHPGIIDAAFFDSRDLLVTRTLDLDLNMLRDSTYSPGEIGGDTWLPFGDVENQLDGGLIYAFREDALREDAIARPPSVANWATYAGNPDAQNFRMRVNSFPGQDPPVNDVTGISPKPVDYYADPDRRSHGFRLRNGETVRRIGGGPDAENLFGMSMITDNTLYIKGDLNFHRVGGNEIEEFNAPLLEDYSNFYSRTQLNSQFANPSDDDWRPVELLADIVSPLSAVFCEGSMQDSLTDATIATRETYGCARPDGTNQIYTSFTNNDRPTALGPPGAWWHENRFDVLSPAAVDYAGRLLRRNNGVPERYPSGDFENPGTTRRTAMPVAADTTVNAVLVSGIGPTRYNQSYGGLHNFPPMLERWRGIPLRISGAFLQLSFRTSSTGPFDTDAWETDQNPDVESGLIYYDPPLRRWGYDVGLQYAPAGPIASRFVTLGDTRSEFYSEPTADDPYVCLLRRTIPNHDASDCD